MCNDACDGHNPLDYDDFHYLHGECTLCKREFFLQQDPQAPRSVHIANALDTGWCHECFKQVNQQRITKKRARPFAHTMAWRYECRVCLKQVVAASLPASPRLHICPSCIEVNQHRAEVQGKRLRFAPDGCDLGPVMPAFI